jgi:hypothetical protein
MECPKCHIELADSATYCGCGWNLSAARKENRSRSIPETAPDPVLGYIRCEWRANNTQCRYPGSITSNVGIGGPWYCGAHYRCHDPIMEADIVEASQDYRHPTRAVLEAEHQARCDAKCAALNLKTVEERRAWVWEQAHKLAAKMKPEYHNGRKAAEQAVMAITNDIPW